VHRCDAIDFVLRTASSWQRPSFLDLRREAAANGLTEEGLTTILNDQ
jgi:hypothetical protein